MEKKLIEKKIQTILELFSEDCANSLTIDEVSGKNCAKCRYAAEYLSSKQKFNDLNISA